MVRDDAVHRKAKMSRIEKGIGASQEAYCRRLYEEAQGLNWEMVVLRCVRGEMSLSKSHDFSGVELLRYEFSPSHERSALWGDLLGLLTRDAPPRPARHGLVCGPPDIGQSGRAVGPRRDWDQHRA